MLGIAPESRPLRPTGVPPEEPMTPRLSVLLMLVAIPLAGAAAPLPGAADPGFAPSSALPVPAVVSRPLPVAEAAALWAALDRLLPPGSGELLIVDEPLWQGLADRAAGDAPTAAAAAPAALDEAGLDRWFAAREGERTSPEPGDEPAPVTELRHERDALGPSDLARRGPPPVEQRWSFVALAEEMEAMRPKLQALAAESARRRGAAVVPDVADVVLAHARARVLLLSAPADRVAGALRIGGWNECPAPEVQTAVLRRWRERWGARLVYVGADTLELDVRRPPTAPEDVRAVAWEQYLYCSDSVEQGAGTLTALATSMTATGRWFFWWD